MEGELRKIAAVNESVASIKARGVVAGKWCAETGRRQLSSFCFLSERMGERYLQGMVSGSSAH